MAAVAAAAMRGASRRRSALPHASAGFALAGARRTLLSATARGAAFARRELMAAAAASSPLPPALMASGWRTHNGSVASMAMRQITTSAAARATAPPTPPTPPATGADAAAEAATADADPRAAAIAMREAVKSARIEQRKQMEQQQSSAAASALPPAAGATAGAAVSNGASWRAGTAVGTTKLKRDVAVFKFDAHGNYAASLYTFAKLKDMSQVAARDLLALESSGRIRSAPTILPRRKCILLNISHVKAIVFPDSVLLLDVHRPVVQNFAEHLKSALRAGSQSDETQYFEFRVLECVLKFVCQKYSRRMSCFHPVINTIIREMNTDEIDTTALHTLLPLKNSLAALERATTELLSAITALLKNDDDMLDMFLTEKARRGGELPPREAHAELELLLENYHREISTLTQEAGYLRKTIQSGQDMMNIALDTYRNRMVRINAQMAMATVGLSTGVSVFGVFGMNLNSGLEAHPTYFWWVAGSGYGIAALAWLYLHRYLARPTRSRSWQHRSVHDMQGVRAVMDRMGDIQDIVLLSVDNASKLSKGEFRALLERASGRSLTNEEMNSIFRVYDRNSDDILETDEIKHFLADQHSTQYSTSDPARRGWTAL